MTVRELVEKNRSYRRFYEEVKIDTQVLRELIDLARISSSGANRQSLKYLVSNTAERNEVIFQRLRWAAYLKDWNGPEKGERPSAYIVMLHDKNLSGSYLWDHGIAAENILLGAVEKGLGGCMFGSVDKEGLTKELDLPENLEIVMVIALGKPKETVVLEELGEDGDIKYWRDAQGIHHVPKRALEDILIR